MWEGEMEGGVLTLACKFAIIARDASSLNSALTRPLWVNNLGYREIHLGSLFPFLCDSFEAAFPCYCPPNCTSQSVFIISLNENCFHVYFTPQWYWVRSWFIFTRILTIVRESRFRSFEYSVFQYPSKVKL